MKIVKVAVASALLILLLIAAKLALEVKNIEHRYHRDILGIGVIAAKADASARRDGHEASFNQDALIMAIGEVMASIPQEDKAKFAGESLGIRNGLAYIEQKARELRERHYPQNRVGGADGAASKVDNPSPETPASRQ